LFSIHTCVLTLFSKKVTLFSSKCELAVTNERNSANKDSCSSLNTPATARIKSPLQSLAVLTVFGYKQNNKQLKNDIL
jgi:hypothetical protein